MDVQPSSRIALDAALRAAAQNVCFSEDIDDLPTASADPDVEPPSLVEDSPFLEVAENAPDRPPLWRERHVWLGGIYSFALHLFMIVILGVFAQWLGDRFDRVERDAVRAVLGDVEIADIDPAVAFAEVPVFSFEASPAPDPPATTSLVSSERADLDELFASRQFVPAGMDSDDPGNGFQFALPRPGRAVTKGSFTVWTEPADPRPFENYHIVVQIRVPRGLDAYPRSDLRIEVRGTDRFHLKLPDPRYQFFEQGELTVIGDQVQLVLPIPGARANVRDTIDVESVKILREKQRLELKF